MKMEKIQRYNLIVIVMEVVPGDTSEVLTFTLFILPSSVTLDRGSNGGGDGGKSMCASVIFCILFSG